MFEIVVCLNIVWEHVVGMFTVRLPWLFNLVNILGLAILQAKFTFFFLPWKPIASPPAKDSLWQLLYPCAFRWSAFPQRSAVCGGFWHQDHHHVDPTPEPSVRLSGGGDPCQPPWPARPETAHHQELFCWSHWPDPRNNLSLQDLCCKPGQGEQAFDWRANHQ